MIKIFISILELVIFVKLLLFWLWLWQLKEYHLGRFRAHFESQAFKKIISSLWWLKFPKFTKKIIVTFLSATILAILMFFKGFYFLPFVLIILIPLLFQIPTLAWRKALIEKAKQKREKFKNLLVIGITGSYGKTSTKEFLATILSEKYGPEKVLKTKEHQNSEVGISQCILNNLKSEHQIFVCEMGTYNRGGIKLLCDIAKPKIGILTGINEQHLSTFGSQENIIKTKYELIESLPKNGLAIFNGSNLYTFRLYLKTKKPKKIYRFRAVADHIQPDLFAKDILSSEHFIAFRVYPKGENPIDFKVNVLGTQHITSILAGALVSRELGMTYGEIALACQKIKPEQGTLQLKKGINSINIVDATYSANPQGVIADLEYLNIWKGKKVMVMPCLIELGSASPEIHRRIARTIAEVCDLAIITTKDRFRELKEGIGDKAILVEKAEEILERIKVFCQAGDVVLLEGRVPKKLIYFLSIS